MAMKNNISIAILAFVALGCMFGISFAQNNPQDYVDAHNKARAEVGVPPVTWDDNVAKYALDYANVRAADCNMEHSHSDYGENLASGEGEFSGVDAVNLWISEKPYYDPGSGECVNDGCLHYTQVVWRHTEHIGCARVQCQNKWWFITCNYSPHGNVIGEHAF